MTQGTPTRGSRLARISVGIVAGLLIAGLLPVSVVLAAAPTVTSATGGTAISADTFGTGAYTTLTGPQIVVATAADLTTGTITLTAPAGFEFATGGTDPSIAVGATGATAVFTSATVGVLTFTVTGANTDPGTVIISLVRVRPDTNGTPLTSGEIQVGGTSSVSDATAGTLTQVPGVSLLSFDTEPSVSGTGGTAFAQQPVVESADQYGNLRTSDSVTLAIKSGTGTSGAALTCTTNPVVTVAGLATFAGCKIDKAGDNYKLRATVSGGTAADSNEIDIAVGTQVKLGFTSQPKVGFPSSSFSNQPVVAAQDAGGNTVVSYATTVTISKSGGAGTLTCTGVLSKATVNGVATFSGCQISAVGLGNQLSADETADLTNATGNLFDVVDRLAFSTQPAGAVGGVAFTTQPVVEVRAGASATSANNAVSVVTLALSGGPAGAVLTCTTNPVTVSAGVAAFAGCKIDKAGTYTLTATSPSLNSATSSSLAVVAGPASKVAFTSQPTGGVVTQVFPIQPVVAIQDAGTNTVTTTAFATATVTLAIGTNPSGGTLTCTGGLSKAAVAGVATFSGCAIDRAGTGYTLVATASSLASATTSAFNITVPTAAITLTTSAPIPPGAQNPVILWGQGFTLSVQFAMPNGGGKTFQLQGTRDGLVWTTITNLTTDGSGRASLLYTPVTNLFYRVVFAGTTDLGAANSNQVRTVVRQLALLRPTNSGSTRTINRNTSITFTTTVRPARPELAPAKVSFYFYRQVSGAWQFVTKRDVYIDGAGLASTTFRFSTAGQWYVRSQANPTPYNANSVLTPVERYSVR